MADTTNSVTLAGGLVSPLQIRVYKNRKMYAPSISEYVTLTDIAEFVAKGGDVMVYQYPSGLDLTAKVLSQAVAACPPVDTAPLYAALRSQQQPS